MLRTIWNYGFMLFDATVGAYDIHIQSYGLAAFMFCMFFAMLGMEIVHQLEE
jgi:hypothetical protein